jgi:hypothetical protein
MTGKRFLVPAASRSRVPLPGARVAALMAGVCIAAACPAARAQSGGTYDLRWNTFDGGGATFVTGGVFSLGGTIGQPDASPASGGVFLLAGGFWQSRNSVSGVVLPSTPPPAPVAPLAFRLHPPSPNPARGSVDVAFDLPETRAVQLTVYNLQGARVRTLAARDFPAGSHRLSWNGTDEAGMRVGTGVYYLRLEAGASRAREKIIVVH